MSVRTVDARGLSCPQPVILALDAMKCEKFGQIEILVDSDVCVENVTRAARSQGWMVSCDESRAPAPGEWILELSKEKSGADV